MVNGIKVAVLDNDGYIALSLNGNRLPGKEDFTGLGGAGFPYTGNSHGTACAGIIAAQSNSNGISGVAPSAKFIPIRVSADNDTDPCTSWATFDLSQIGQAIRWAVDSANADVLSCSWGSANSSAIQNAITYATTSGRGGKGALVIFAAGNFSSNQVSYPSSLSNVISVGASNMCDKRKSGPASGFTNSCGVVFQPDPGGLNCDSQNWWGSNYGTGLDIMAPGVLISTTGLNETVTHQFGGTSAACPFAAGTMALILNANSGLSGTDARAVLEATCDKVGGYSYHLNNAQNQPNGTWHEQMGHGRINAQKAVLAAFVTSSCPDFNTTLTPETYWQTHQKTLLDELWYIYRVDVVAGNTYQFNTGCIGGATANFDNQIVLYDANCNRLNSSSNICLSSPIRVSESYTATYSGLIYVKVVGNFLSKGSYTLSYKYSGPAQTTCNLSLSSSSASVGYNAGSRTFSINANGAWNISSNCNWVSFSQGHGSNDATITVNYSGNKSLSSRQCVFTVSCGSASATYTLTQAGMNLSLSSPNNGATSVACNNGVTFNWSSTVGNPRYRIQVSTSSSFNDSLGLTGTIVFQQGNLTSNSFTVPGLNSNTQYFWTVRVHDETNGILSHYISPRSFWTGTCGSGGGGCSGTPVVTWVSPQPPSPHLQYSFFCADLPDVPAIELSCIGQMVLIVSPTNMR
ncbi:MAG: S8 family serine peptidase [Chitinophagales bacterium]|nr:S8 family serine peptidase [Chitinophagales bacterium]